MMRHGNSNFSTCGVGRKEIIETISFEPYEIMLDADSNKVWVISQDFPTDIITEYWKQWFFRNSQAILNEITWVYSWRSYEICTNYSSKKDWNGELDFLDLEIRIAFS